MPHQLTELIIIGFTNLLPLAVLAAAQLIHKLNQKRKESCHVVQRIHS